MDRPLIHFEKKSFPIIKIYDDSFEIKAVDHWEFRAFDYTDIKEIKYYDPNNNWYTKLLLRFSSIATQWAAQDGYRYLKVYKNNNGYWNYILPEKFDFELIDFLKIIEFKIGSSILNIKE